LPDSIDPDAPRPVMGERMGQLAQRAADALLARMNLRRAAAYRAVFLGEDGEPEYHAERVLADLRRFCRGDETTYRPDAREHALLEGRREVFLRIVKMLGMTSEEARNFVEVNDE
jgi:hypothetical protein